MKLFSDDSFVSLGVFVAITTIVLTLFFKWKCSFWRRHNLPTTNSSNGFLGLFLQSENAGQRITKIYKEAKSRNLKHIGWYFLLKAIYIPIDPEIIKHILTKDFNNFMDRGVYFNEETDPLSVHLFSIEGEKWKTLRQKLSPTFTSGQIKMMFQTLVDCGEQLREYFHKNVRSEDAVDIKEILASLTTDIIGSCAFGIQCNTLENPNTEFRKYGRMIFELNIIQMLKLLITVGVPTEFLRKIGFTVSRKDVTKFFMNVVEETVNYREKQNIYRKDFMQLLLQLKNNGSVDEYINPNVPKLTMNEIAAQAFVFYAAGFETSSTAMTFALYEMALNQVIQEKAREEIYSVLAKYDGKLTYEGVMEMSYLQKIVDESLRKYPPASVLDRQCKNDYKVPGTDFILPKGVKINIPVMGLHHDPEYYPDPEKFDPERFSEENKSKRPAYTYLPFGDGPRICIGMRFGLIQAKVGLVSVLRDYRVKLHPKTLVPLVFDPKCLVTSAKGSVYVSLERVSKETPAA